jgi:hypothetical protein
MSMIMAVKPPTAANWPELERQARRVAVARAPLVPVTVGFWPEGRRGPKLTATWQGQVYGSLAVTEIGVGPPECPHAQEVIRGYQLVHVPTGQWLRSHRYPRPLRLLALALGRIGVDWAAVEETGLAGLRYLAQGTESALWRVCLEWDVRYGC